MLFDYIHCFISRMINYLFYYLSFIFWHSKSKDDEIDQSFLNNYYFKLSHKKDKQIIHKTSLRCCTWNIHHGYDIIHNYTMPFITSYIQQMDFDIIFLQEVNNTIFNINNEDITLTTYLSQLLDMESIHYNGLTILSKFPLSNMQSKSYYVICNSFGNHILQCDISLANNKKITCINTHLNSDIIGYEQYEAIPKLGIDKIIEEHNRNDTNLLIAGDFNSPRLFYLNSYFSNMFNQTDINNALTFPTIYPITNLDKVWCNKKNDKIKINNINCDDSIYFSDHRPLLYELILDYSISVPVLIS